MPHTFPRRRYRTGEVVAPGVLTEEVQLVASKLNGRLNEHDVDGPDFKAKVAVQDGAYYGAHQFVRASSPGWRRGGGHFYALPGGAAPDTATASITDSVAWQTLQTTGGTETVRVNFTAAEDDQIFILAQPQWCSWQNNASGVPVEDTMPRHQDPLRLQFALAFDGVVLDDTITGGALFPDPPPQQWYRATVSSAAADQYDYRQITYIQNTCALPMAVNACRLSRATMTTAGTHYVELLARRIPTVDGKVDNTQRGNAVEVFNRRLYVMRIRGRPAHSGSAANVNVSAVEDGTVLTHTYFTTDTFAQFQTAVNDVKDEHLSRGIFRNQHLPSKIYGAGIALATDNVKLSHTGRYPGFGTASAQWTTAGDGAAHLLRKTGPTAGEWDLAAHPGVIVILADVELTDILWGATPASPQETYAIGCFAIMLTNAAGTQTVYKSSEVYVNSSALDTSLNPREPIEIGMNVPLMLVLDSADLSAADKHIAQIDVLVSTWDANLGANPTGVTVKTRRGTLLAYVLEGVHLA